jgi:hypothetical protein
MLTICQAIARYEGFNKPNSRAARNHNPGNIQYGEFARTYGGVLETIPIGIQEQPRFAFFPSDEAGELCLSQLLNKNYTGMTVLDAFNKYAPPVENNTNAYAQFVCDVTGLQLDSILTDENIG